MIPPASVALSGARFRVRYRLDERIAPTEADARARASEIAVEQTVEFPIDLLPPGDLRDRVVGRVEDLRPAAEGSGLGGETYQGGTRGRGDAEEQGSAPRSASASPRPRVPPTGWIVTISYAVEITGADLTQLLNVVFGNSSLKPGIRVEWLELSDPLLEALPGPRFGREGLRATLGIPKRALLCTALKPMGLPVDVLAELTYRLALGGIDIIKDDHGLADQTFAPFVERVRRCVEAVERANRETGQRAGYAPNVTADGEETVRRTRTARAAGARAILISPGLAGLGQMARLAADDGAGLPILSHPAFLGSYVVSPDSGISHATLFGQIARLAGADGTIYPNYGGRFSFSPAACRSIADAAAAPLGPIKPTFPVPGGGMTLGRVPELLDFYGPDVILLVGGGLFQRGPDLVQNCREFRRMVEGV